MKLGVKITYLIIVITCNNSIKNSLHIITFSNILIHDEAHRNRCRFFPWHERRKVKVVTFRQLKKIFF